MHASDDDHCGTHRHEAPAPTATGRPAAATPLVCAGGASIARTATDLLPDPHAVLIRNGNHNCWTPPGPASALVRAADPHQLLAHPVAGHASDDSTPASAHAVRSHPAQATLLKKDG